MPYRRAYRRCRCTGTRKIFDNGAGKVMYLNVIRFSGEQFAGLAAGYGDPSAIRLLTKGQLTKRLVLIREVIRRTDKAGRPARELATAALAVLAEVDVHHAGVVRSVLGHPQLGVWAATCLRTLPDGGSAAFVEIGQLGAFAAAAASRAGVAFDLTIPARGGSVFLPTLGSAVEIGSGLARVHGDGDSLIIAGSTRTVVVRPPFDAEARYWRPQRLVTLEAEGRVLEVVIEDLDPYRDCYPWRPAERLSLVDVDRLHGLLADAWRLIVRDHPDQADGMRAALRSVVPLSPANPHGEVSSASRDAFGSLALSVPADSATLAMLLIHEFQHVKLGGLLDLVDLYGRGGEARYFAPWRTDPRPIGGLLQGAYAFVGVTDFWRRHRAATTGAAAATAEFEFALRRRQTARALEELATSGELTATGSRLVARLERTLRSWQSEPVPAEIESAAHDVAIVDVVHWRLSWWVPRPHDVVRLADAWHRGRPCPDPGAADLGAESAHRGVVQPDLARLIRSRATGTGPPVAASQADRAYLAGDYDDARHSYLDEIQRHGGPDGWAGLAIATRRSGRAGAHALATRPELIRAVLARLATYPRADAVARWLEVAIPPER